MWTGAEAGVGGGGREYPNHVVITCVIVLYSSVVGFNVIIQIVSVYSDFQYWLSSQA